MTEDHDLLDRHATVDSVAARVVESDASTTAGDARAALAVKVDTGTGETTAASHAVVAIVVASAARTENPVTIESHGSSSAAWQRRS